MALAIDATSANAANMIFRFILITFSIARISETKVIVYSVLCNNIPIKCGILVEILHNWSKIVIFCCNIKNISIILRL